MGEPRQEETPRPPTVAGTVPLRWYDGLRLFHWGGKSCWRGSLRSVRGDAWFAGWVLAVPLSLPVQLFSVARRKARYYMSPERDAVLAIVATSKGWKIGDHLSATQGTGRGAALRSILLPELSALADRDQLTIHAAAAHPKLAARYTAELPGLTDVGRAWPRGRKLHRPPQPVS